MTEYEQVYCTDCVFWVNLLEAIENRGKEVPYVCQVCDPYDPEDSVGKDLRINYVEK